MNFTSEAFSRNTEAVVLLSSNENYKNNIYGNVKKLIEENWSEATYFSKSELEDYKIIWKNRTNKLNSLSGKYGAIRPPSKPIHDVEVINMSWEEYFRRVIKEKGRPLEQRIKVLKIINELFEKNQHFNLMSNDERKTIAGTLGTKDGVDWGWFGSMKGSWRFQEKINSNDENISLALDQIPLKGNITKTDYIAFLEHFKKAFPTGNWIATSSRLLTMKRPDVFVCLDNKNRSALCQEFDIKTSGITYERYWDEIIERIFDSNWWRSSKPQSKTEIEVWEGRSAFLDALYYKPDL
jgi:hypothetical protein